MSEFVMALVVRVPSLMRARCYHTNMKRAEREEEFSFG
jgi:hypothetical protein